MAPVADEAPNVRPGLRPTLVRVLLIAGALALLPAAHAVYSAITRPPSFHCRVTASLADDPSCFPTEGQCKSADEDEKHDCRSQRVAWCIRTQWFSLGPGVEDGVSDLCFPNEHVCSVAFARRAATPNDGYDEECRPREVSELLPER
jgi:hypothetical protein